MHHYSQTKITLENLIRTAHRQEFLSYQRLDQAQVIANQEWSFASSLLISHLDQLANKSYREGKPVFSFPAVARKELVISKHTMRRYHQIICALGDSAPAEKDDVAVIKKEQMRFFAWGMEKRWPIPKEKPADAPHQPPRNAEVQTARRLRS